MPELTIGAHIGPYELEAEIGRGGMARVFRARQPSLDRIVALKILAPDLARDSVFVTRFQHEALIAAALEHPNIVPIYDVGETNGQPYVAMRHVAGRSLADALRQDGPFSVSRAALIVEQIARAVDYAHSRGVVHRDLKPANILLQSDDFACLVDFGIARAGDGTRLTRIGQMAGTPAYMSPEQIQGLPGDYLSDLYALGILAFELLSGRVPYNADSDVAMLHQHVYEAPPSIRALRPDLPRFVEQAIERMIAKRPNDRFHSGAAFAAALTNTAATEPARRGVPGGRPSAWIPVAAAAAAVALSALAVVMFRPPVGESVAGVTVTPAVAAAPVVTRTAPPATATVFAAPAATPARVLDAKAECAQRMAGVDAVWETDLTAAVARLEDVVSWDATCGDAKNKLYAARVNRARELLHADRSNDAQALLRQTIQDNPGGGEAVVLERLTGDYADGQRAASSADWPKAIDALSQVHAEDSGFADGKAEDLLFRAYVNYGNSFSAAQQWPQAREQYTAALALRPDDGPTRDLLAGADQHLRPAQGPLVPPPVAALDPQTQQDVVAAIQRSNSAWSNARASLNTADLAAGMAGQELQDDIQVVNSLRQKNQYVMSSQVSFTATRFTSAGPNRVYVDTQESWQDDVYDLATRRQVKHDPPTRYSETYTVDRINGRWIVSLDQVH